MAGNASWQDQLGNGFLMVAQGNHTENAKKFIDFASANGIGGILVEGWNTGWEHWIGFESREGVFDFAATYPDYDLHRRSGLNMAGKKGVQLIMSQETSAAVNTYEQQLNTAFALMQALGIHTVKTGYVGKNHPQR